jgi:hypothetical protein
MTFLINNKTVILYQPTERRGPVVNTHSSYSGSPGFKSLPGDRLSCLRFL